MINRLSKITTEEDIEIFSSGPILSFECDTGDHEEAINRIIEVVNILIEAKLFSRRIGFRDGEKTFDLTKEAVAKFIRKNTPKDKSIIEIYGDTTVYLPVDSYPGPKRSVDINGIIDIYAYYSSGTVSGALDVDFIISSSIWMPFNTKGHPHIDVYTLNLNRFSSVLIKIEALGLNFIHKTSDYCSDDRCLTSGYLLENHASNYEYHEHYELEDYTEDSDDIYGVSRTDW